MTLLPAPPPASAPADATPDATTAARFRAHGARLQATLQQLYGDHPGFAAAYADLVRTIAASSAARPPALKALDRARADAPDWFTTPAMLGYCAYADRFGGTLAGVANRISYLQELGVTYLHLLPFLRARAGDNDGGFAVASFDEVEPSLGTIADLEALTGRLRSAGISLAADLVLNHVADDHAWAEAARAGDPAARAFFHVVPERAQVDALERDLGEVFPGTAPGNFTHVPAMGGWVWTTFYPYQWDLDYGNPAVFVAVAAAMLRLANRGVEVFRLDSAPYLWKTPGTDCRNRPEVHVVLEALRAVVDIAAPGVLLKAEAIVPIQFVGPYLGAPPAPGQAARAQCHLAYHSSLMAAAWVALACADTTVLRATIAATPALPPASAWVTYVRCHDDIVWGVLQPAQAQRLPEVIAMVAPAVAFLQGQVPGSYAAGRGSFSSTPGALPHGTNGMTAALVGLDGAGTAAERSAALRRLLLLYGVALAFGGIPLLYMGDELGQGNDTSEEALRLARTDARWIQRPALDAARVAARHDQGTPAGMVFSALREWLGLRRRLPALRAGVPVVALSTAPAAVLMLARGPQLLALFNFSAERHVVALPAGSAWRDAASHERCGPEVSLGPWQMRWLDA